MVSRREQQFWLFAFSLGGILATGTLFGMGADNWWNLATDYGYAGRYGIALYFVLPVVVGIFDMAALVVIFDASITVVQRFRGRI